MELADESVAARPDIILFPEFAMTGWPYPPSATKAAPTTSQPLSLFEGISGGVASSAATVSGTASATKNHSDSS